MNNMPDGALEATERQFASLLEAASDSFQIKLLLFSLSGVPRGEIAMRSIQERYASTDLFAGRKLDGLIVTGREPLTPNLADEPYWGRFVEVLEWARENTFSTVWSCLAAHAAVLHMDGIKRLKNDEKHCGIFECDRIMEHPIMRNVPALYRLPHSRWNGIPEADLTRCGYKVLGRAGSAGVDSFVREGQSLFLFFQGHPEYESDTLLLEYRRDVNRFLNGETNKYPNVPEGYFGEATRKELDEIHRTIPAHSLSETLAHLDKVFANAAPKNGWHTTAITIYRNWLEHIVLQKELAERESNARKTRPTSPILESAGAAIL